LALALVVLVLLLLLLLLPGELPLANLEYLNSQG
jgi:hypothetical protein